MRSVVKHSYVKGMQKSARAKAHINYIQNRTGADRDKEPRSFFNSERDNVQGREVKQQVDRESGKVVHKVILSPGVPGVDVRAYTRQVMNDLGRAKGLDLNWAAVVHTNTDNPHAHVVIMGKDLNGREVQLRLNDCKAMRESGDRYLERHHEYERYQERDIERLLKQPDYSPEGDRIYKGLLKELSEKEPKRELEPKEPYQRREWSKPDAIKALPESERIRHEGQEYNKFSKLSELQDLKERLKKPDTDRLSEEQYKKLYSWIGTKERGGEDNHDRLAKSKWDKKERKREKKHERLPGEDDREFRKFDKDLKKSFKQIDREGSGEGFGKGYRQRLREEQGRWGAEHGHRTANEEVERLKKLQEVEPSRKPELDKQIDQMKSWDREQRQDANQWGDLEQMLGDRYEFEQKRLSDVLKLPEQKPALELELGDSEQEKQKESEPVMQLDQAKEPEPVKDLGVVSPKEPEPVKAELELEASNQKVPAEQSARWADLDSLLGERFGRDEPQLSRDLEITQSQQEVRQFMDVQMAMELSPKLEEPKQEPLDDLERGGP